MTEKNELDSKRDKLKAFIGGDTWEGLDDAEKDRLSHQLSLMDEYSMVLGQRIAAFAP